MAMKAINITEFVSDPSLLQPTSIPRPIPSANQYLVQITHCSPQHADILHAQGKHQNNNPKRGWCFPPFVLGYDFAGIVVGVPSDTIKSPPHASPTDQLATSTVQRLSTPSRTRKARFSHGDRVFGSSIGSFAQFVTVEPHGIRRVPNGVSLHDACAWAGGIVSYAVVARVAQVRAGETVLVSGASGGLGSIACLLAKACGAKVIALTSSEGKASQVKDSVGVDEVVVMTGDDERKGGIWIDRVQELTDGKGVDVVIDHVGIVNDAIRACAFGGRIVIVGFAARKGAMETVKTNALLLRGITLTGYRFGESGRRFPEELERISEGFLGLLKRTKIKPVVYSEYHGLEDIGRALRDLMERKICGKTVVTITNEETMAKL